MDPRQPVEKPAARPLRLGVIGLDPALHADHVIRGLESLCEDPEIPVDSGQKTPSSSPSSSRGPSALKP
jgi:hypothetical protein